jgi:hypothetical protein
LHDFVQCQISNPFSLFEGINYRLKKWRLKSGMTYSKSYKNQTSITGGKSGACNPLHIVPFSYFLNLYIFEIFVDLHKPIRKHLEKLRVLISQFSSMVTSYKTNDIWHWCWNNVSFLLIFPQFISTYVCIC